MAPARTRRAVTRRDCLRTVTAAGAGAAAARRVAGGVAGAATALAAPTRRGGVRKVAEVGEPLTLDTVASTSQLTSTVAAPIFEELLAFDANWRLPLSLASSTTVSADGLTYTFALRRDVPFHSGAEMTAADVVASLNRWGKVSPHGVTAYQVVDSVQAGSGTVTVKLKSLFAPLLAFLALPQGAAAMLRVENRIAEPIVQQLRAWGHTVEVWPAQTQRAGSVCLAGVPLANGVWQAAADTRREAVALGW